MWETRRRGFRAAAARRNSSVKESRLDYNIETADDLRSLIVQVITALIELQKYGFSWHNPKVKALKIFMVEDKLSFWFEDLSRSSININNIRIYPKNDLRDIYQYPKTVETLDDYEDWNNIFQANGLPGLIDVQIYDFLLDIDNTYYDIILEDDLLSEFYINLEYRQDLAAYTLNYLS